MSFRKYEDLFSQHWLVSSIFINFLDFFTFPCYKKTNDGSIKTDDVCIFPLSNYSKQIVQHSYKIILILDKFFLKSEEVVKLKIPPSSLALLELSRSAIREATRIYKFNSYITSLLLIVTFRYCEHDCSYKDNLLV